MPAAIRPALDRTLQVVDLRTVGVLDAARFGEETRRAAELGSVTEETPRIGLATDPRLRRDTRKGQS